MNSQWKAVFDTSILIVIGYSCFTTVLYISFALDESKIILIINTIVMCSFAMDFVFKFFEEYLDQES
jgi:hypothetical protein